MSFILAQSVLGVDALGLSPGQSAIGSIPLNGNFIWQDEADWTTLRRGTSTTINGALIIEDAAALQAGRPITLGGDGRSDVWLDRATVEALRLQAEDPANTALLLVLPDGREYTVAWRYPGPMTALPIIAYADPIAADNYAVTLRFMETVP